MNKAFCILSCLAWLFCQYSCTKEGFTDSPDARLRLSVDTLRFDTVFTSAGSVTQQVKIFNDNDRGLRISRLRLGGGTGSYFYLNADGIATKDISTIPDTIEVVYEFPNYLMTWSNACANSFGFAYQHPPFQEEGKTGIGRRLGVTFQGDKGTLLANYGAYHLVSEGDRMVNPPLPEPYLPRSPGHEREFLDCIKSRELPSCDVEKHYPLAVALNLGNLSYKVGRKIRWDAAKEEIIGDPEANALLTPNYRNPWTLPV